MPTSARAINRRTVLTLPLLSATASALPAITGRAAESTLRYVPYSNLIVLDPVWSISIIGLEHAFLTCDQLYGLDESYTPRPQMAAGHELSDDKRRWRITLRDGLVFHDGEPVRAADCVASIGRWAKRDPFGQRMAASLDEMHAVDDKTIELRLKRPYGHLLYGLGGTTCFIRPERLAKTDIGKAITDQTGSGPYRFLADEFVSGGHAAYARNTKYVPRQEKPSSWAGGKHAYFERVEWKFIPDPATSAAALQTGEVDWVERPLLDLVPKLKSSAGVSVSQVDPMGYFGILFLNNAAPPFDNPKLAHALLPAINQADFMAAVVGDLRNQSRTGMGMFTPGSPFASDAGMAILNGKRDPALARKLIGESGYKGEKVVLMIPEVPEYRAMGEVTAAAAAAAWVECRCAVDGLGHAVGTCAQHRPDGARRLELLLRRLGRAVAIQPRQQHPAVRRAAQPGDGGAAQRLVRCRGCSGAACAWPSKCKCLACRNRHSFRSASILSRMPTERGLPVSCARRSPRCGTCGGPDGSGPPCAAAGRPTRPPRRSGEGRRSNCSRRGACVAGARPRLAGRTRRRAPGRTAWRAAPARCRWGRAAAGRTPPLDGFR